MLCAKGAPYGAPFDFTLKLCDDELMYLVHVSPVARGVFKEALTYFSKESITPGTVVMVPVRSRTVPALVIATESAREAKASIKSSDFALKRLAEFKGSYYFPAAFLAAAQEAARYSAATEGAALQALIPQVAFLAPETLAQSPVPKRDDTDPVRSEKWLLQVGDTDRTASYRALIRESFNRGRSVFLCVPTSIHGEQVLADLSRGIEDRAYLLSSTFTKKKLLGVWQKALAHEHPVLVIGTAPFLALPRTDWGLVIVERESSRSYRTVARPYLDLRIVAESFAESLGIKFILGDSLIRPETFLRYERGEIGAVFPPSFMIPSPPLAPLIDMREFKSGNGTLQIISPKLEQLIRDELSHGGRIFIFAARKGLAPTTVCNDCGTVVSCRSCGAPVVLNQNTDETRSFVCRACGEIRDADNKCVQCGSWRFALLGISTSKTAEELQKLFPETPVRLLEGDTAKTAAEARRIAHEWNEGHGILVGTEMALPYLPDEIGVCAIASLDALLTLPDFRMTERIVRIAATLRERARSAFVVQTRMPDHPALAHVLDHSMRPFYREELETRERFGYPPFTTLIKITVQGRGDAPVHARDGIAANFADHKPSAYETGTGTTVRAHLLLKLPTGSWPEQHLLKKLRSLPPYCIIRVDPDDLL
ncbi:MAG: hypothetical protein A2408_02815 [Candidatus Yonathbacteria bacterium RIFOXYC1_FULL_52_10]|nr:MAG: hypothetical protein A2408_02815 [Candidatus Yonathbacteria bacterium RIFOXYC1_FULL_52_10]